MKKIDKVVIKIEAMLKEANKEADSSACGYDEGFYVGRTDALEDVLTLLKEAYKLKENEIVKEKSTVSLGRVNGIEFIQYNSIVGESDTLVELNGKVYDGFYVSYNNYDIAIYGDVTTALVLGQMQKFYILVGNHCEQYKKLINQGFPKCLEYFKANISQAHRFSDKIESN